MKTINQLRRKMNRSSRPKDSDGDVLPLKLSRDIPIVDARRIVGVQLAYLHPTKGIRFCEMPVGFRGAV